MTDHGVKVTGTADRTGAAAGAMGASASWTSFRAPTLQRRRGGPGSSGVGVTAPQAIPRPQYRSPPTRRMAQPNQEGGE